MKAISIGAPDSKSGKTVASMVITSLLKNEGLDIGAIKCGPDHIDSKLLSMAAKSDRANIDLHLQTERGMKKSLGLLGKDYGLIEGVMGYFDGISTGTRGSTYHISEILDINSILVYKQKGEMYTMVPKIQGLIQASKSRIKGIILSDTSRPMYEMIKPMLEENLDIQVLGYIGHDENLKKLDASLDYDISIKDQEEFDHILDKPARAAKDSLDVEKILELFKDIDTIETKEIKKSDLSLAIAHDRCFDRHYGENIKLFESYFSKVDYFSPLSDKVLPQADLVYIGGGYVKDYLTDLSSNSPMINSLKDFHKNGGHIYAEGGGLEYLCESFDSIPMVGLVPGEIKSQKRLQNFGYNYIRLKKDCLLGKKGDTIPGHEYHKSTIETDLEEIFDVEKASKKAWQGGYQVGNLLASFQYINFSGNEHVLENIISHIKETKCISTTQNK